VAHRHYESEESPTRKQNEPRADRFLCLSQIIKAHGTVDSTKRQFEPRKRSVYLSSPKNGPTVFYFKRSGDKKL